MKFLLIFLFFITIQINELNSAILALEQWKEKVSHKLKEKWNEITINKMSSIGNQAYTRNYER